VHRCKEQFGNSCLGKIEISGTRDSLAYHGRSKISKTKLALSLMWDCELQSGSRAAFYAKSPDFEELTLLDIRIPRNSIGSDLIRPVIQYPRPRCQLDS
jgi:hypothetical protein